MRVSLSLLPKLIVVLALSLALAAIGFGHRDLEQPNAAARALDPAYLAFVAAGGTAQDLCEDHAAGAPASGHSDHVAAKGCEACRLVDLVILPAAEQAVTPWDGPRIVALWPSTAETLTPTIAHLLARGRAPPRA